MRLGQAARARSLPSPTVAGCAAGVATPPRLRAARLRPWPPREGPEAPPPGRGSLQVRVQGSRSRLLGLREME